MEQYSSEEEAKSVLQNGRFNSSQNSSDNSNIHLFLNENTKTPKITFKTLLLHYFNTPYTTHYLVFPGVVCFPMVVKDFLAWNNVPNCKQAEDRFVVVCDHHLHFCIYP